MIRLGPLEIYIAVSNPNLTSMSQSSLRVITVSSLVYPYFELDFEGDEISKALLMKQETK